MKNQLNENELKVLQAIKEGHGNAGGDFTYFDEVYQELVWAKSGINQEQAKGYLSQLVQKGYIEVDDDFGQINFNKKSLEIYPDLEEGYSVY